MKKILKPNGFGLLWKLAKITTFMPSPSSSGSEQSSQAGWLSQTFFCKRKHSLGIKWLSVKLTWGRANVCKELKHMKAIHRLIYYLWKRNALLQLQICSPNKIFQYITRVQIPYKVKGSLILKPPPPPLGRLNNAPSRCWLVKGGHPYSDCHA